MFDLHQIYNVPQEITLKYNYYNLLIYNKFYIKDSIKLLNHKAIKPHLIS